MKIVLKNTNIFDDAIGDIIKNAIKKKGKSYFKEDRYVISIEYSEFALSKRNGVSFHDNTFLFPDNEVDRRRYKILANKLKETFQSVLCDKVGEIWLTLNNPTFKDTTLLFAKCEEVTEASVCLAIEKWYYKSLKSDYFYRISTKDDSAETIIDRLIHPYEEPYHVFGRID